MNRTNTCSLVLLIGLVMLAAGLAGCGGSSSQATLPFFRTAALTPEWIEEADPAYQAIPRVGDFALVNQDGVVVTNDALARKIYVANFFFVQCTGICPTMRTNLATVQAAYADDDGVALVSHTVLPEKDTVPVLKNYGAVNGVRSGKWHLLTGERMAIYELARTSYFVDLEADAGDNILHSERFVLVDPDGRIRGVYNGTLEVEVQRLIEDIALLRDEYAS